MAPQLKNFDEILKRFSEITIDEEFDLMVAIANGGIIPAAILNQKIKTDLKIIRINFKDDFHRPQYDEPRLLQPIDFDFKDKRILLVDDRIKSGSTIQVAKKLLEGAKTIKTFAVNGNADYALYNEPCFRFPWNI